MISGFFCRRTDVPSRSLEAPVCAYSDFDSFINRRTSITTGIGLTDIFLHSRTKYDAWPTALPKTDLVQQRNLVGWTHPK